MGGQEQIASPKLSSFLDHDWRFRFERVHFEGKREKLDFRKEVSAFWENAPPFAGFTNYTKVCRLSTPRDEDLRLKVRMTFGFSFGWNKF
jgi:hypothetical protein